MRRKPVTDDTLRKPVKATHDPAADLKNRKHNFKRCQMPEDGHYVICNKCNIWYHPSCEGLDINEIPESSIFYFCKKCLNPKRKKKKNFSLFTTTQLLKSEVATNVRSKMKYVSYMYFSNFKVNIFQNDQQ